MRDFFGILTIGAVSIAGALWVISPGTTQVGGWAHPLRANNIGTTVVPVISNRGGSLVMLHCNNPNTGVAFVQVFDAATNAAVTVGTTVPTLSFAIPGSSASGYALAASGIGFGAGIQMAATNTATGNGANGTGLDCNAGYL
jgi:hypothetical protein